MKTTFLESKEDMQWLREVHTAYAAQAKCAILHGNEDAPTRIELYADNHVNCVPIVLVRGEDGELYVHYRMYYMKDKRRVYLPNRTTKVEFERYAPWFKEKGIIELFLDINHI